MVASSSYQILFGVGGGLFSLLTVLSGGYSVLWWVRRKTAPVAIITFMQFAILMFVYWLLYLDWFPKQRNDGREFPWYRDVAMVPIVMLLTWILGIVMEVSFAPFMFSLLLAFGGAVCFVLSNFSTADVYWWGFWFGGAGFFVAAHLWLYRSTSYATIGTLLLWIASLIIYVGFYLVQMFSWTMLEIIDKSPKRFGSEVAYFVMMIVGVSLCGILASAILAEKQRRPVARKQTSPPPSAEEVIQAHMSLRHRTH